MASNNNESNGHTPNNNVAPYSDNNNRAVANIETVPSVIERLSAVVSRILRRFSSFWRRAPTVPEEILHSNDDEHDLILTVRQSYTHLEESPQHASIVAVEEDNHAVEELPDIYSDDNIPTMTQALTVGGTSGISANTQPSSDEIFIVFINAAFGQLGELPAVTAESQEDIGNAQIPAAGSITSNDVPFDTTSADGQPSDEDVEINHSYSSEQANRVRRRSTDKELDGEPPTKKFK